MESVVFGIMFFAIYFLPSILGYNKRNANSICVLNLFLGWTLIGWVVALVWALSNDNNNVVINNQPVVKNTSDELIKLKELLDNGILTKEEFDIEKTKILK